jgi:photosystem II stability/assembly factor-like uncharacterized protein
VAEAPRVAVLFVGDRQAWHMRTVYVAFEQALVVLRGDPDDGGWTSSQRLVDRRPECVLTVGDDTVLTGTSDAGLYRSTDGGRTWGRVGRPGIGHESVTALAANPSDPTELWAGTEPSTVFHSTDGGDSWTERPGLTDLPSASGWSFPPRPETHHVRWLEVDPADPAHLYVGVEAGAIVQTRDRGETWVDRQPGSRRDPHSMATHPEAPGRLYVAAGDGYAESRDGGYSWVHPQEGLDHRYVWSVAVDAGDPEVRLVSAATGAFSAHTPSRADTHVYRRTDDRWTPLSETALPQGDGVTRPVLAAGDPGEFYAASNRGLARSADGGRSWTVLDVDWPVGLPSGTVRGLALA